ncbi:DMT family transporter [Actinopolymorpha alba]|uniref:DMT family transporter n=1 Tax=Actinopolymorpha alba TaxID=533267 RepID=UPI00036ED7E3|nr:DMT family transporter [Actinopolymorpha alba]
MTQPATSPRHAASTHSRHVALGLGAAFFIGLLLACQSRINGELGHRLGDGVLAALWSFGSGLVVLLAALAVVPGVRHGLRRVIRAVRPAGGFAEGGDPSGSESPDPAAPTPTSATATAGIGTTIAASLRPWQVLGGLCGAFLVVTQSLTVGLVGVAAFTVAVVAGQATSSLVVDRLGLGPGGRHPITPTRILGATLTLGAVLLSVSDELGTASTLVLALLPALAGIGTAWQQAVNGWVGAVASASPVRANASDPAPATRTPTPVPATPTPAPTPTPTPATTTTTGPDHTHPEPARGTTLATAPRPATNQLAGALVAALVNFSVGTAGLLLAATVDIAARGLPGGWPSEPVLYLGGLFGIAFISLAAAVVRITGVLLLGLGTVAGQLVGALVLDGMVPTGTAHLTTTTVIGTLLTLVAVTVAALPRNLPRRRVQRA